MTMSTVIKIIGVVIVLLGVLYLVRPSVLKVLLEFFRKGSLIYVVGLIRLALAVVFLLAATKCSVPIVITVFGVLFMVSGLATFMLGPKRLVPVIDWFLKQPPWVLRILGVITSALAGVIIYAA